MFLRVVTNLIKLVITVMLLVQKLLKQTSLLLVHIIDLHQIPQAKASELLLFLQIFLPDLMVLPKFGLQTKQLLNPNSLMA